MYNKVLFEIYMNTDIRTQIETLQDVLAIQKQHYSRHGSWLIAIGVLWLLTFGVNVLLAWRGENPWYQLLPWLVLTLAAFAVKRSARSRKMGQAVHWHNRVLGGVWLLAVAGMWVTPLIAGTGRLPNYAILPLLEWWTAMPMVVSGLLFRSAWFSGAGVAWFLGGVLSLYLPPTGRIIVYPSLIVVAYLLPALQLTLAEHQVRADRAA